MLVGKIKAMWRIKKNPAFGLQIYLLAQGLSAFPQIRKGFFRFAVAINISVIDKINASIKCSVQDLQG